MSWLVLVLSTPLLTAAGYLSRLPWLLPVLQILPAYPQMLRDLRDGKTGRAVLRMLLWALLIAVTVELLALHRPAAGADSVIHGTAYRDEMIRWVRTGVGAESSPSRFLPQHLLHLVAFILLALATGSVAALLMGAMLMNYMSFYVGGLMGISARPALVLAFGWPPWAMVRVAAYVILGVVLAGPVLRRCAGVPFEWRERRPWIAAAAAGVLLDVGLKAALAPTWSRLLRSALFPLSAGF